MGVQHRTAYPTQDVVGIAIVCLEWSSWVLLVLWCWGVHLPRVSMRGHGAVARIPRSRPKPDFVRVRGSHREWDVNMHTTHDCVASLNHCPGTATFVFSALGTSVGHAKPFERDGIQPFAEHYNYLTKSYVWYLEGVLAAAQHPCWCHSTVLVVLAQNPRDT